MEELDLLIQQLRDAGESEETIQSFKDSYIVPEVEPQDEELQGIVSSLKDAGESQETINSFIKEYESPTEDLKLLPPSNLQNNIDIANKAKERRDASGETYVLPEGFEGLEDTVIGDFFTDVWRAGAESGTAQRALVSASSWLDRQDPESIQEFMDANIRSQNAEVSAEMLDFQKRKDECGGGAWCTLKAIAANPSVATQIMASSLVGMTSLEAGGAAIGGAGVGSFIPGVGTGVGAFAAAGGYTDAMVSFSDFIGEELGEGTDWNNVSQEQVVNILNDPEKLSRIRGKAAARGISIAVVDALTFGIASKAVTKTLSKTGSKALATTAGLGVESTGGAAGEFVAQVTAGQDIDTGEILLEGIAELGGPESFSIATKAIRDGINSRNKVIEDGKKDLSLATYKLNDEDATREDVINMVKNATPEQILSNRIDVTNDEELSSEINNYIDKLNIDKAVDSRITGEERTKTIDLEQELSLLKEDETEGGKLRKKVLRDEIQKIASKSVDGIEYIAPNDKPQLPVNPRVNPVADFLLPGATEVTSKEVSTPEAVKPKEDKFLVLRDEETNVLEAIDEDGKQASPSTEAKYIERHLAETPSTGDTIVDKIGQEANISPEDVNRAIADESENAVEVAQALKEESAKSPKAELAPLEDFVFGYKVRRQSFIDNSDKANVTKPMSLKWFNKEGVPLDKLAIEASDVVFGDGRTVTEQEIVDIIINNPSKKVKVDTDNVAYDLQQKFTKLTGAKPTARNIAAVLSSQQETNATEDTTTDIESLQELSAETEATTNEEIDQFAQEQELSEGEKLNALLDEASKSLGEESTNEEANWWEDDGVRLDNVFTRKPTPAAKKPTPKKKAPVKKLTERVQLDPSDPFVVEVLRKLQSFFGAALDVEIRSPKEVKGWGKVVEEDGRIKLLISSGDWNTQGVSLETLLHEPGHIIYQLLESSTDPKAKEILTRINDLIIDTAEYKEVIGNKKYTDRFNEQGLRQEAFAKYFGKQQSTKLYKAKGGLNKAIADLLTYIKDTFGVDINPSKLGLRDISDILLADLASGNPQIISISEGNVKAAFDRSVAESKKGAEFFDEFDTDINPGEKKALIQAGKLFDSLQKKLNSGKFNKIKGLSTLKDVDKKGFILGLATGLQRLALNENIDLNELLEKFDVDTFGENIYDVDTENVDMLIKVWELIGGVATEGLIPEGMDAFQASKIKHTAGKYIFNEAVIAGYIDVTPAGTKDRDTYLAYAENEDFVDGLVRGSNKLPGGKPAHKKPQIGFAPSVGDGAKHFTGFNLFGKRNKGSGMTRESHPLVYKVYDKLWSIPYLVNNPVREVLEKTFDNSEFDVNQITDKKGSKAYKKELSALNAKKRSRDFAVLEARGIGDNTFYSMWKRADQGRFFSTIDNFNIQGNKTARAMYYFADKKKIGKYGLMRVKIQAVDFFGITGKTFEDRLAKYEENEKFFMDIAKDPVKNQAWKDALKKEFNGTLKKKGEPELFLATIMELHQANNDVNFKSGLPIWGDAQSSGPQFIAGFTGDDVLGAYVGLTEALNDLYSFLGTDVLGNTKPLTNTEKSYAKTFRNVLESYDKKMKAETDSSKRNAIFKEMAELTRKAHKHKNNKYYNAIRAYSRENVLANLDGLALGLRDVFKNPVMIVAYSAGVKRMATGIMNAAKGKAKVDIDYATALIMAQNLSDAIDNHFPVLRDFMNSLKLMAQVEYDKGQVRLNTEILNEASPELKKQIKEYFGDIDSFSYTGLIGKIDAKGNRAKTTKEEVKLVKAIRSEIPNVDSRIYGTMSHSAGVDGYIFDQSQKFIEKGRQEWTYTGNNKATKNRAKKGKIKIDEALGYGQLNIDNILTGIVAEFIQSVDPQIVSYLQLNGNYDSVAVHDDFAAVPGDTEALFNDKRKAFDTITGDKALLKIFKQFTNADLATTEFNKLYRGKLNPKDKFNNVGAFDGGNVSYEENIATINKLQDKAGEGQQGSFFDEFDAPPLTPRITYDYFSDTKYTAQINAIATKEANDGKDFIRKIVPYTADDNKGLLSHIKNVEGLDKVTDTYEKNVYDHEAIVTRFREEAGKITNNLKKAGFKAKADSGVVFDGNKLTVEQAIQAYVDNHYTKELVSFVEDNKAVADYANWMHKEGVLKPSEGKNGYHNASFDYNIHRYITKDLYAKNFSDFNAIVNEVLVPAYPEIHKQLGTDFVDALQNSIYRMSTGNNNVNKIGKEKSTDSVTRFFQNTTAVVMFLNFKAAATQLISVFNYAAESNNPFQVLGNMFTPNTWKEAKKLYNHPTLKERRTRAGLDVNISEAADVVENSTSWSDFMRKVLQFGFSPTQFVDSIAQAWGGAAYIKAEMANGVSKDKATRSWVKLSRESQQSSDPSKVSQQQTEGAAKLILTFANTPAQYFRLSQKALRVIRDKNSTKKEVRSAFGKIVYYQFVQGTIFTMMSTASTALLSGFSGDDEEDEKALNAYNSMTSSTLRGMGIMGAGIDAGKSVIVEAFKQGNYRRNPNYTDVGLASLNFSPIFKSKIDKLRAAGRTFEYDKGEPVKQGLTLAANSAAFLNIPADWVLKKGVAANNLFDDQFSNWQKFLMGVGYPPYIFEEKEKGGLDFNLDVDIDLDLDLDI